MKRIQVHMFILLLLATKVMVAQPFQTPAIIPPSPTAQNFMRYGEIPVDYSTGVPNISIPLYTIEGTKLKLPVSISYHASGIKVNDIASEIGLGWVLNTGGMVTRTVLGQPDEYNSIAKRTFASENEIMDTIANSWQFYDTPTKRFPYLDELEFFFNSNFESEDPFTDRFYYNLPTGINGVFRYDYFNENLDDSKIFTLPTNKIRIEKTIKRIYPSDPGKIETIKITDEEGTQFYFDSFLTGQSRNLSEWFLTKMISFDGTDTIFLSYEQSGINTMLTSDNQIYSDNYTSYFYGSSIGYSTTMHESRISTVPQNHAYLNPPLLTSIRSKKSFIEFTYSSREDFTQLKKLIQITIKTTCSNEVIMIINFSHKYFGTNINNKRLALESLSITSPSNSNNKQNYNFVYENIEPPPYPFKLSTPLYGQDFWGYYNGKQSPSMIPIDFINNIYGKMYGVDRKPDVLSSKICMIKEIKYPTGGKTVFQFERNYAKNVYQYEDNPDKKNGYIGGFRINNIKNYDENNILVNEKTYEYSGACFGPIDKDLYSYVQKGISYSPIQNAYNYQEGWDFSVDSMIFSEPIVPIEIAPGLTIMYSKVVEYNGSKTENAGKIIYEYLPKQFTLAFYPPRFNHTFHNDFGNYTPELISKSLYSYKENKYTLLLRNTYKYQKKVIDNKGSFQTGIKLTRTCDFHGGLTYAPVFGPPETYSLLYAESIVALDTKGKPEPSLLVEDTEYAFDPNDSTKFIKNTTNYDYNNIPRIKEKITLSSKNDLIKTSFKYPIDFCNSNNIYCKMVERNIITPVVEKIESVNNNPISAVKTNYSFWKNDAFSTQAFILEIEENVQNSASSTFTISNRSKLYVNINLQMCASSFWFHIDGPVVINRNYSGPINCGDYITLNPQETFDLPAGNYTVSLSYQGSSGLGFYGYATGTLTEIKPGSTISTVPTEKIYPSSIEAKTGNLPYETRLNYLNYDIAGNLMTVSKTNDLKEIYIWGYNRLYPVAKIISNYDYSSIEALLGGPTNVNNFSIKATPSLTEIKTFLAPLSNNSNPQTKNILLYTYSWKPLIGMNSETDPNGTTTYYEYDNLGRLNCIKNADGNILKTFEYQLINSGSGGSTPIPCNLSVVTPGSTVYITFTSGTSVKSFVVSNSGTISVPSGTYTIGFSISNCSGSYMYSVMGVATTTSGCSATLSNVNIQSSSLTIMVTKL